MIVERVADGVSTVVHRVRTGGRTWYLRFGEEPDDDLWTDAELHARLLAAGVPVPRFAAVTHVPDADRWAGLTTEVPGGPLTDVRDAPAVLEAAGRHLRTVNSFPVEGFGFVRRRGPGWPLRAEFGTHEEFVRSHLPDPWPGRLVALLTADELDRCAGLVAEQAALDVPARLVHGDFDVTPVFCVGDRFTGLVDFGEARGAEPWFDRPRALPPARRRDPARGPAAAPAARVRADRGRGRAAAQRRAARPAAAVPVVRAAAGPARHAPAGAAPGGAAAGPARRAGVTIRPGTIPGGVPRPLPASTASV